MTISNCCGAATKVEYRTDHPVVFDDPYELLIPVLICTNCGKVVGLDAKNPRVDPAP